MKIIGLVVFATYFFCSNPTSAGLEAIADVNWETDYDKAIQTAKEDGKTVLINFTGSDWCGWCKRLEREVFSKDEFIKYANENLVMLKLDFPKYKRLPADEAQKNKVIANKYGVRGFPTILLLNSNEKELKRTGYKKGGPLNYINHLKGK